MCVQARVKEEEDQEVRLCANVFATREAIGRLICMQAESHAGVEKMTERESRLVVVVEEQDALMSIRELQILCSVTDRWVWPCTTRNHNKIKSRGYLLTYGTGDVVFVV